MHARVADQEQRADARVRRAARVARASRLLAAADGCTRRIGSASSTVVTADSSGSIAEQIRWMLLLVMLPLHGRQRSCSRWRRLRGGRVWGKLAPRWET